MRKIENNIFFNVPQEPIQTSIGNVNLPIFYYDVNVMYIFYLLESEKVQKLLEKTDLEAIRILGNKSLVCLAFFEYKNTSIGIYNEVGMAIAVKEKERKVSFPIIEFLKLLYKKNIQNISIGFWVQHLPVTTKEANVAGREIWGYPKFITKIPIEFDFIQKKFSGKVQDPNSKNLILSIEGKLNSILSLPAFSFLTYSYLGNKLIRTIINVKGRLKFSFNKSFKIQSISSNHTFAQTLKQLGLENHPSYAIMYGNHWQSRLNKGNIVLESKKSIFNVKKKYPKIKIIKNYLIANQQNLHEYKN